MQINGLSPVQMWSLDDRFDLAPSARGLGTEGSQSGDGVDPPPTTDDEIFYSKSAPKKSDAPKVVRVECPAGTTPAITLSGGNTVEVECKKAIKTSPSGGPVLD